MHAVCKLKYREYESVIPRASHTACRTPFDATLSSPASRDALGSASEFYD